MSRLRDALVAPGQRGRVEIPDVCRADLPAVCVELGYRVGVEVGVDRGRHLASYCAAGLTMVGVDPWAPSPDYALDPDRLEARYREAQACLAPFGDRAILRRLTSLESAAQVPNGSLDVVYLDGHHGFASIAADLWAWAPKVRPGGLVAGHDYFHARKAPDDPNVCHVPFVLEAWTRALHISPWFVLGRKETIPGERRDKSRSWCYLKRGPRHA